MENGKIGGVRTLKQPINIKYGMRDYVGDVSPHDKIQSNRPSGASRHMGEISLTRGFLMAALHSRMRTYTLNHKKRDILFLTITLSNLNRFLQFLYHFNREEILHATLVKFITSP